MARSHHGTSAGYATVTPSAAHTDFTTVANYMFWLMLRNVASDGFVFTDPVHPGVVSRPGCVIASPSCPQDDRATDQDYVYNWTRDAALVALELAAGPLPNSQPLNDYVGFARTCQGAGGPIGFARYWIDGSWHDDWTEQTDGPALRVVALLNAFSKLDPPAQDLARQVIATDLDYLRTAYQASTFTPWEEHSGRSFFATSVHLRCFREVSANRIGIDAPAWLETAVADLEARLAAAWNGNTYVSVDPAPPGYDPNADVLMACVYGAVEPTDPRLLATAAELRRHFSDPASGDAYPVNAADAARGIGPLIGRYPADYYDGDSDQPSKGHPWAICTCNFAELYYRVAAAIQQQGTLPPDPLVAPFFYQVGVEAKTRVADAAAALRAAGDRMLDAIVFHSDHLELSEQFDQATGFEKSVSNLTWSYAAFLSAVRARNLGLRSS